MKTWDNLQNKLDAIMNCSKFYLFTVTYVQYSLYCSTVYIFFASELRANAMYLIFSVATTIMLWYDWFFYMINLGNTSFCRIFSLLLDWLYCNKQLNKI